MDDDNVLSIGFGLEKIVAMRKYTGKFFEKASLSVEIDSAKYVVMSDRDVVEEGKYYSINFNSELRGNVFMINCSSKVHSLYLMKCSRILDFIVPARRIIYNAFPASSVIQNTTKIFIHPSMRARRRRPNDIKVLTRRKDTP